LPRLESLPFQLTKAQKRALDQVRADLSSGTPMNRLLQVIVRGLRVFSDFEYEFRMALANHSLSPDIEVVALITNKDHSFISGSTVREIAALDGDVSSMVPEYVEKALRERFLELGSDQNIVPHTSLRD